MRNELICLLTLATFLSLPTTGIATNKKMTDCHQMNGNHGQDGKHGTEKCKNGGNGGNGISDVNSGAGATGATGAMAHPAAMVVMVLTGKQVNSSGPLFNTRRTTPLGK